jgi:hypothetical protein
MKKQTASILINSASPEQFRTYINKIITSDRNKIIQMHKDYYDNIHWDINEVGRANASRSGKWFFGRQNINNISAVTIRDRQKANSNGGSDGLTTGQLQTKNYVKLFIQTYQDFLTGGGDEPLAVTYKDNEDANEILQGTWGDIRPFLKSQLAKLIINTVAITKTVWDNEEKIYKVEEVEAENFVPIYKNKNILIGGIECYYIDTQTAILQYPQIESLNKVDSDQVSYAEIYIEDSNQVIRKEYVNGYMVSEMVLIDQFALQPYTFVANIDHAFRQYDEKNLEDSEIFNWIDKNDSINANETIAFVVNLIMATPKYTIDAEKMNYLGVKLESLAFKQAMQNFSPFLGQVTELPIQLVDGTTVPDSFYQNLERMTQTIYEDAGIPKFIVSGEGISNISEETMSLAMSVLNRKLEQKKQQLHLLIQKTSEKILDKLGIEYDSDVSINWIELGGLSQKQLIEHLVAGFQAGLYPKEYTYNETLKLIGRSDDIAIVKEMDLAQGNELIGEVQEQANILRKQKENELIKKQEQEEINEANAIASAEKRLESLL